MKIVTAEVGSMGRSVTLELLVHSHDITLISNMSERLHISSVADADWVLTSACSPGVLRDASVVKANVTATVVGDNKASLVISPLVKAEFAVPHVIARLNNPKNRRLSGQTWNVDVSMSTPCIMTSLIEKVVSMGVPVHLFPFSTTTVPMHAFILPKDSPIVGERVHSLQPSARSVPTVLLRDGRPIAPSTDDIFGASDEFLLLVPGADTMKLEDPCQLVASPVSEESEDEDVEE